MKRGLSATVPRARRRPPDAPAPEARYTAPQMMIRVRVRRRPRGRTRRRDRAGPVTQPNPTHLIDHVTSPIKKKPECRLVRPERGEDDHR